MKKHALLVLWSLLPAAAQAADSAWVQATTNGFEARLVTEQASCPVLHTAAGDSPMMVRAAANGNFPLVCAVAIAPGTTSATVAGVTLPLPVADPQRILVLGDTGCRIKGAALQACNDPAGWPFPQLAAAAARLKPDLVIHVGDYLYRESACPPDNAGCAGSPWGDNWVTWAADFYTPAAPLLAAAPIVLVRGNHEDCNRAGPGWERLQGPGVAEPCTVHDPLYIVALGKLTLAVLDDAVSGETDLDRATARIYAEELAGVTKAPAPANAPIWLIHHRPTWAAITGPLGIPIGGNLTLMEGSNLNAIKGAPLIPRKVELMLSGHIHTFESINYTKGVPPQIVAGNGGDNLDVTPKNLRGTQFLGHTGVKVLDGLSVGGFGFLLMTRSGSGWNVDLFDSAGTKTRTCRFAAARLDCPA